jgi:hypothetical protein
MAKPPIRIKLKPPVPAPRPAPKAPKPHEKKVKEPTQADLDRHSRMQGLEQRDAEKAMRERKPSFISTTVRERTTPTGRRK